MGTVCWRTWSSLPSRTKVSRLPGLGQPRGTPHVTIGSQLQNLSVSISLRKSNRMLPSKLVTVTFSTISKSYARLQSIQTDLDHSQQTRVLLHTINDMRLSHTTK